MALIKSVRGFTPEIGENCFLADNATIIGDVKIGNNCSVWFSLYESVMALTSKTEVSCIHYTRNRLLKSVTMFLWDIMLPFTERPSKIMH